VRVKTVKDNGLPESVWLLSFTTRGRVQIVRDSSDIYLFNSRHRRVHGEKNATYTRIQILFLRKTVYSGYLWC
jgi:hypothetical protein